MRNNKTVYWRICQALAMLLMLATFSPWVISSGTFEPSVMGLPYSLWIGILISILLVLLTFWATKIHPDRKNTASE
ncbi:MAG: hypothetical protein AAGI07_00785 [Bacteroidota bacterium]